MSRTTKQPKTGGKAVDSHCQNNGICPTCISNRTISSQRQESKAVLALREYLRTTPQEELDASFAAVEAMDIQGPTLDEVLAMSPVWQLQLAEQQLAVANAQLEVVRKALKEITNFSPQLDADIQEHGTGRFMYLWTRAVATKAIQDMRNLKRK